MFEKRPAVRIRFLASPEGDGIRMINTGGKVEHRNEWSLETHGNNVVVETVKDGAALKAGSRGEIAAWLQSLGYRYVQGTNAIWQV